jgi:hypothetical protein
MRGTLTFVPKSWTRQGGRIIFKTAVPVPDDVRKRLPALGPAHVDRWTVYMSLKHWQRVSEVVREHPESPIVVEGHVTLLGGQLCLVGRAVRSQVLEKQRQQEQRAASLAAVAQGAQ